VVPERGKDASVPDTRGIVKNNSLWQMGRGRARALGFLPVCARTPLLMPVRYACFTAACNVLVETVNCQSVIEELYAT
jgi:hypothetical protein